MGPAMVTSSCKDRRLVDGDVGAAVGEALVGEHVFLGYIERGVVHEGHGLGGIADVFVEGLSVRCGWVEGKFAVGMKEQSFGLGVLGRPRGVLAPHVCAGFEDIGFGKLGVAGAFQVVLKKWEQNIFAIVLAGVGGELNATQVRAVVAGPSAVNPGADDERVENSRIIFVDGMEC